MRILVLPGYYGFGKRPRPTSAGVFFRDQAVALSRAGHHVTVMYVHFDRVKGSDVEVVDDVGVRCVYIHAAPWPRLNSVHRVLLMLAAFRRAFPAGQRPDILHAHVYHALPVAWIMSKVYRVPYVVTEHSSKVKLGAVTRGWALIARPGYAAASAVIAVSDGLAHALSRYTRAEVVVVPNLVRDEFFGSPIRHRDVSEPFTFLSIGYCDPVKGWDILVRAFARFGHDDGPCRLVLCGEECPMLAQIVDELGLRGRVQFTGRVAPKDMPATLSKCHCHVMPSRTETFGIASAEALASGKPIIMTATDAASSIVTPINGVIVPIDDVAALSQAMRSMKEGYSQYDGPDIRRSCERNFSGASIVGALENVYQRVRKPAHSGTGTRGLRRRGRWAQGKSEATNQANP